MMLKHHIKVALRNIKKQGIYSLLNVTGLSIGVTLSLLVLLLVKQELNYDTTFSNSSSIYRYTTKGILSANLINNATSPMPLGEFVKDFKEVNSVVRFIPGANNVVAYDDIKFNEDKFRFVDPNFFEIFDLEMVSGESDSALLEANTLVLSESTANKYFGNADPMGKKLVRSNIEYTITGVCKDMPSATHFKFSFLASIATIDKILLQKGDSTYVKNWKTDWLYLNCYTYVKLNPKVNPKIFEQVVNEDKNRLLLPQIEKTLNSEMSVDSVNLDFFLQPIEDIHLHSQLSGELEVNSKSIYINLFVFIAIFILLTTCVNFINLTTAKARRRFKEVGLRQMIGASRRNLAFQFLTEAVVYSFGATFFGLVLLELLLPFFNFFFDLQLEFSLITGWIDFFWILLLVLSVGIIAGGFPAFFFAGLKPKQILQGEYKMKDTGLVVRGILVCSQVAVSVFLLIVVSGMWWQIQFIGNHDPGFNSDNIMVIERGSAVSKNFDSFKAELLRHEGIESVSACSSLPGDDYFQGTFKLKNGSNEKVMVLPLINVDEDYFTMLDLTLKTGRFLSHQAGDSLGVILNTRAIEEFKIKKPLGQKIEVFGSKDWALNISGVVKDFHYEPYNTKIKPLALILLSGKMRFEYVLVKLNPDYNIETINAINDSWSNHTESSPFVWEMLDKRIEKLYDEDIRIAKIISVFAILALFMTIMGIIALAAFLIEYKSRNIGIIKILGASRQTIILQVFSDFSIYIIVGVILAMIPSYIVLTAWIENYAYSSFINIMLFPLAALIVAGLAFASVFYQTYRMASDGPIEQWQFT